MEQRRQASLCNGPGHQIQSPSGGQAKAAALLFLCGLKAMNTNTTHVNARIYADYGFQYFLEKGEKELSQITV
ncbi:hypothetical protein [Pseudomonas sp. A-R-26]|uniref:hypothetical protein n=1 Tax=Pseudomonas sp. A-R-26 TaxID=2832404 RepID=UPI001CBC462C|nr:hypothetical protein [Pseudomonas sp. A-R-26]